MSPRMRPVCASDPSQRAGRFGGVGGITWTTGSPKRVTSTSRHLRTLSRMAKQLTLNLANGNLLHKLPN